MPTERANAPTRLHEGRRPPRLLLWWGIGNTLIAALLIFILADSRTQAIRYAERNALNLVHLLEQRVASDFEAVDLALQRIAADYAIHAPRGADAVHQWLQSEKSRHPTLKVLLIADTTGRVRYGPGPDADRYISVADREYFSMLRDHRDAGLQISAPVLGRTTGTKLIVLARRLEIGRGLFAGVIFAAIPIDQLGQTADQLTLGKDDHLELRTHNGQLIVSRPPLDTPAASQDPLAEVLRAQSPDPGDFGIVRASPGAEYLAGKIIAFHRNSTYGFSARVGLARADALTGWTRVAYVAGWLYGAFALLSLLFLTRMARAARGMALAIDALHHEQAAVADRQRTLMAFLDHLPGLAYIKDSELRVQSASRGFHTILGMDPAAMLGKRSSELFPEDFARKIDADDRRVLASGVTERIEESLGGRWYETIKFTIPLEQRPSHLGGITMDATQRHLTTLRDQILLALHERAHGTTETSLLPGTLKDIATLCESPDAAIWIAGGNDQHSTKTIVGHGNQIEILEALLSQYAHRSTVSGMSNGEDKTRLFNSPVEAAARSLSLPPDAAIRRAIVVPVCEDQRLTLLLGVANKSSPYHAHEAEALDSLARGLWRTLQHQRAEIRLNETVAALTSLNTRLEQAQNQLLQSEKMAAIGQLAAGVAHELNNPIGFVQSNLGTLITYVEDLLEVIDHYERCATSCPNVERRKTFEDIYSSRDITFIRSDVRQLLAESRDGADRVRRIVQNLKDFSHVSEDEWVWADLHKGIESTLTIVWNELKYKAEVVKQFAPLPEVYCVPAQLNQVFMNLLVNAAQAIESHGRITITTGFDDEQVWVDIADTGKGIPPENHHRIFEPFYTTKPVGKGTGLGLSLAYSIVQKHRGTLSFTSAVGEGTTFHLSVPRLTGESGPLSPGNPVQ